MAVMLGIGIIGTGNMGADHARRVDGRIDGARLVALHDADLAKAAALAKELDSRVASNGHDLIGDPDVAAIIVASPSSTHPRYVLAAIAAGKPILCEKPLALTVDGCLPVLEAEATVGRRLVTLGFMRRFDAGYRAIRAAIRQGTIGTPLALHCIHRNHSVPATFTTAQTLTEAVVHEIDCSRWLLGEEIAAVTVLAGRRDPDAPDGLADPLLVLLETTSGVIVDVEAFVTAGYGYDVRCEVIGSAGFAALPGEPRPLVTPEIAPSLGIPHDWLGRFGPAYDSEVQAWVDAIAGQGPAIRDAATAWDGYMSIVIAAACVASLDSGARVPLDLTPPPAFYA